MLASLMSFSARQDNSALKNLDSQPVNFYKYIITSGVHWSYKFFIESEDVEDEVDSNGESASAEDMPNSTQGTSNEGESKREGEEEIEEVEQRADNVECESKPDLEMAGVKCSVYSQQVEAEETEPNNLFAYLQRVHDPYGYIYPTMT